MLIQDKVVNMALVRCAFARVDHRKDKTLPEGEEVAKSPHTMYLDMGPECELDFTYPDKEQSDQALHAVNQQLDLPLQAAQNKLQATAFAAKLLGVLRSFGV